MAAQMFDSKYLDPKTHVDTAIPRFFTEARVDERASKAAGHQIFVDVEMVEIICPGDKNNVPTMPVDEVHKRRWPGVYAAFKQGLEQLPEGFPLTAWPHVTQSLCATLKAMSCHTVEQLAGMSDANLPKYPDIHKIRDRAREFLAAQQDATMLNKLQAQVDDLSKQLEIRDAKIDDLISRLEDEAKERKAARNK